MLTYMAAAWLFSALFSYAAYYGVAWNQTTLTSPGSAGNRIAEFSFLQLALLGGLGLSILLQKTDNYFRERRFGLAKSGIAKVALAIFLIVIFASSAVAQAYPRFAYDSRYTPIYYDEYPATFQEPYYLGMWWNGAFNQTGTATPWSGSRSLEAFVMGYGWQPWWIESLNQSYVELGNTHSKYLTVYYGLDTLEIQKPDHATNDTLPPEFVSSGVTQLNNIFNTGRIMVVTKPSGT